MRAGRSIVEADLHVVSIVSRPRDPLARIESIDCEDGRMSEHFDFVPSPDSMLLCHDCMYPCTGFSGRDRLTPNATRNEQISASRGTLGRSLHLIDATAKG